MPGCGGRELRMRGMIGPRSEVGVLFGVSCRWIKKSNVKPLGWLAGNRVSHTVPLRVDPPSGKSQVDERYLRNSK